MGRTSLPGGRLFAHQSRARAVDAELPFGYSFILQAEKRTTDKSTMQTTVY